MGRARELANVISNGAVLQAGDVGYFALSSAPSGWLKANGAAVSRTAYAALFASVGTTYGSGDGSTTFNLPDLRGEFIRGWDDGRGVDSGRGIGTAQGHQMQSHNHEMQYRLDSGGNGASDTAFAVSNRTDTPFITTRMGNAGGTSNSSENRPRNIALLACIKF